MRSHPALRLALNVLVGALLGLAISQILSGCSDADRPLAPAPSAGIAAYEAPAAQPEQTAKTTQKQPTQTTSSNMPLPNSSERYHLSWDGKLEGEATRSLSCEHNNCRYQTLATVVGLASLSEISDFQWADAQVQFQRYERTFQMLFKQTVTIEKQADGSIRSERRGKEYRYAAQPGLVDILNIEVQLRADRIAGQEPKASYPLADSKGISAISLHREADDTLTLLDQERPCEVYVRKDGKRTTTLWLDPAQDFLPLQIIHQDGAETYRMEWMGPA